MLGGVHGTVRRPERLQQSELGGSEESEVGEEKGPEVWGSQVTLSFTLCEKGSLWRVLSRGVKY